MVEDPSNRQERPEAPPSAGTVSIGGDALEGGAEGGAPESMLTRLNPMRFFRRKTPASYVAEGRELLESQRYAQATVAFNNALAMDPNCVPAWRGLGKVAFKKGGRMNLQQALAHYQEAVRRAPLDHELYAFTAKIYDLLGQRKEATLERKKFVVIRALETDPDNPVANNNMGILFLQQGQSDRAISYFRTAIQADRNYDVAHRNLATVYFQQAKDSGNTEQASSLLASARQEAEKALQIAEKAPTLLAYARILLATGEAAKALESIERADAIQPASKDVFLAKKVALERLGRFDEAKSALQSYQVFAARDSDAPATGAQKD